MREEWLGGGLVGAQGEISREGSGKMAHIEMFQADCQSEEGEFLRAIKACETEMPASTPCLGC